MRLMCLAACTAAIVSFAETDAVANTYVVIGGTVVQTDCECTTYLPFQPFDTSLGSLYRTTFEIDITKVNLWQVDVPYGSASSINVDWSAASPWVFSSTFTAPLELILTGSGSEDVPILGDYGYQTNNRSYGAFFTHLQGSAFLDLNPALFLPGNYLSYAGFYTGHYTGAGTTVNSNAPDFNAFPISFTSGEDDNGSSIYRLTYYFIPGGTAPLVPEPSTWAMMLLGFGAVGALMRRRKTTMDSLLNSMGS